MEKHQNKNRKNTNCPKMAPHVHENAKPPTLTPEDRTELDSLVGCLLDIGFKETTNPKVEWEQYVDAQALLTRINVLEKPLHRPSAHTTPEMRLANIEAFYVWVAENGVKFDGVRIAVFPGYELGLVATRDIAHGEELFSIPRKLILSEESLDNDFGQFGSMSNIKLTYALMLESLKPNSFWRPYINLLPEQYNTVLYYTVDDMEKLRGSNAFTPAIRHCKAIARQYAFIYNFAQKISMTSKMKAMGERFKGCFTYDLYRWAVSTVMTRENMIPRSTINQPIKPKNFRVNEVAPEAVACLIPFWDMANHRHGELSSFFNIATQRMESAAQSDFNEGEQIFIYYGDRSNAELLVHNGFICPDHPKDSVSIKLGLGSTDRLFSKRAQLLSMLRIPANGSLQVLLAPRFISPELLAFVRVFNMNEEQLDHWLASRERSIDLLHSECALETALETKTWQYLQTRLMLLLRVFPTTLEADELELDQFRNGTLQLGYIDAMILQFRVLEKRLLSAALEYTKQRTKI